MSIQQSEGAAEAPGMSAAQNGSAFSTRPDHVRRRTAREARRQRERDEIEEAGRLGVVVVPKLRFDRFWTEDEDDAIRRHRNDEASLRAALLGRTPQAIKSRRAALFVAERCKPWTTVEDKILRANVAKVLKTSELVAMLTGRSLGAVAHRLVRLGLSVESAAADTGNPLIDALKDRCRALGYTMKDLDRMSGTGKFFTSRGWRRGSMGEGRPGGSSTTMMSASITRAINTLGGTLRVDWPDDGESVDTIDVGKG